MLTRERGKGWRASLPLESDFKVALCGALSAPGRPMRAHVQNSGTALIKNRDGSKRGFKGAPKGTGDIVGIAAPDGLHFEVETKVGEEQTEQQKKRQEMIERHGGAYALVEYDPALDMATNVARGVVLVDEAIARARLQRLRLLQRHTEVIRA